MKKSVILIVFLLLGCFRDPQSIYEQGNKDFSKGNYYGAIEKYTRAVMMKNKFPEAITSRGLAYEQLNQKQKAVDQYLKSIYVDKNYLPAYANICALYMDSKNYKDALYYANEALKINPKYYYALYSAGLSSYMSGKYALAIDYFSSALKQKDEQRARYYLARSMEKTGDLYGALDELKKLFAADENNAYLAFDIGRLKYLLNDFSAIEYFTLALEKNESGEYYYYRAKTYYKMKFYSDAYSDMKKALALLENKNSEYLRFAGYCALSAQDQDAAKSYFEYAFSLHNDERVYSNDMSRLSGPAVKKRGSYGARRK